MSSWVAGYRDIRIVGSSFRFLISDLRTDCSQSVNQSIRFPSPNEIRKERGGWVDIVGP